MRCFELGFLDDTGLTRLWSKINTKISTAKTEVLSVANDYTDSQISSVKGDLPSYWQSHVDTQVSVIRNAMKDAGRNKSSFLWYTDAHWANNYQKSPGILKYLVENTPIQKVNFGGGISNGETTVDSSFQWRKLIRGLKHHSVLSSDDSTAFGAKGAYSVVMASEETPDIVRGGDYFYFIDDPNERTRYFYLDTHQCTSLTAAGDAEMVQFIIEALARLPEGWHAVAISHIWWLRGSSAIPDYCNQLLSVFNGYNLRKVGSVTVNGITLAYDFTNALGMFEFCIGGNSHTDHSFITSTGIPVILTQTDGKGVVSGVTCTPGTITENSVSAVIADYSAAKIKVIRIGRGSSFEVAINHVNYTNMLSYAVDANDAPYNGGIGYKNGYYASSSGVADTANANYTVTGLIPYKKKSNGTYPTIYVKGLPWVAESSSRLLFFILSGSTKTVLFGVNSEFYINGTNGNLSAKFTFEQLGDNYWKLTPTSAMNSYTEASGAIQWLRMSLKGKGENLIITLDEPI